MAVVACSDGNVEGEEADATVATGAASTATAVDLLDRFYAALPEAMGNTMCAEGDSLATAARVGRARGLLGLFALATSGVYQKPGAKSVKENQNGSANATGSGGSLHAYATAFCVGSTPLKHQLGPL